MTNKIRRIAIICGYSFPDGMAPTTRILAYSKGLVEDDTKVDIFIFFPTESVQNSFPVNGMIYGINYHYPGTRTYPKIIILRKLSHLYYGFIAALKLIKEHRKGKFDFVIVSIDWLRILYLFIPIIRFIKSKPIFIADEYPVPIRVYLQESIPKWKIILYRFILNHVDGMIFMTNNLMAYYNNIVEKPSFILPSITDLSRFSNLSIMRSNDSVRYICYMGNMELSKDNVDNIIEAFGLIANRYSNLELHLYGAPSSNDLQIITEIISKLNLADRVIFKGKVANSEVPKILHESFILVSSQPISKRAEGGFPTKLGEYMASGVPTLITDVGEISNFVTDGVNVWLAKACNPVAYSQKLDYIINNYTEALYVAENAKKYVLENFDYKSQSKNLKEFLSKLSLEDKKS